jgi:hypothetical protein
MVKIIIMEWLKKKLRIQPASPLILCQLRLIVLKKPTATLSFIIVVHVGVTTRRKTGINDYATTTKTVHND